MGNRQEIVYEKYNHSQVVAFIRGEDAKARHQRRYEASLAGLQIVRQWCEHRGVSFMAMDLPGFSKGKWSMRVHRVKFATWLPHLGRLTYKRCVRTDKLHIVKVHDYHVLLQILEQWADFKAVQP